MTRTRHPCDPTGELLGQRHYPQPDKYYYPPEKYVAVHRTKLSYLGAGEASTLWNAIARAGLKDSEFTFGKTDGMYDSRVYDCFSDIDLLVLWKNTFGSDYTGVCIREDIVTVGKRIKPLPTPVSLLAYDPATPPSRGAEVAASAPVSRPARASHEAGSTQAAHNATPPVEGSKTGRVWSVASAIAAKYPGYGKKQLKDEVIRACVKEGINPSTAQVQFGKWYSTVSH